MHDYTISDPHCVDDPDFFKNDCGSTAWAYALFVSWNILSMYIFANMVMMLVLTLLKCSFSLSYTKISLMYIKEPVNFACSLERKSDASRKLGQNLIDMQPDTYRKTNLVDSSLYHPV
jgi:hypothetical protein